MRIVGQGGLRPFRRGRDRTFGADILSHVKLPLFTITILAMVSDASAVFGASVITGAAYHCFLFDKVFSLSQFYGVGAILAASTVALFHLNGLYAPDRVLSIRSQLNAMTLIWATILLSLLGVCFTLKVSEELSRGWILSLSVAALSLLVALRLLLTRTITMIAQRGALQRRNVVLIADGSKAAPADEDVLRAYEVVRVHLLPPEPDGIRSLLRAVVAGIRGSEISELHIAADWSRWPDLEQALGELRALPLPVRLIADNTAREILRYPQHNLYGTVAFEIQRAPLTVGDRLAKRLFDVAGAMICLVALAPLLLLVAVAIWIDSPGPILFRQRRGGFNGRAFEILKFRTMYVTEDGPTVVQAKRQDERVTRVGYWLRRASIDELPQLVNVLRGDMSLTGPRPHARTHDAQYSALIASYPNRHHVKPGMTGWAQVNGFRGETPTLALMKQRVEMDLWYVTNWSFWLDLRILFWTVLAICRSRNAF